MAVHRYPNIDKSKGDSESISKNLLFSPYQENEKFLTKFTNKCTNKYTNKCNTKMRVTVST